MIIFRIPPSARLQNLRRDRARFPPLFLSLFCHGAGDATLLGCVIEDSAAILGTGIAALSIFGGWVVHFVEKFDQAGVGDYRRVKGHLESLGVCWRRKLALLNCSVERRDMKEDKGRNGIEVEREKKRTACAPRTYGAIARVFCITSDIPHSCIQESFPLEALAE